MSKNRPDRSHLKFEGTQDADTQRLKIKPTPTQAAMTAPEPWGDWYKRPWQKPEW